MVLRILHIPDLMKVQGWANTYEHAELYRRETKLMTLFGEKLEFWLAYKKIGKQRFAKKIGMNAGNFSNFLRGRRGIPNEEMVHRICDLLDLTQEERKEMHVRAAKSTRVLRISDDASPKRQELMFDLCQQLTELPEMEIDYFKYRLRVEKLRLAQ